MNIFKVLPSLEKQRHLALFHAALRSQWSAEDVDWSVPQRIVRPKLKDELARVLTPVLMGEQSAFYSLSTIIPVLGHRCEVESQMFLSSMMLDEARHTEIFARLYGRIDREPLSIRRFPSGYLFQSRIVSQDPSEWLVGSLVSEVLAKLTLETFRDLDVDPVLSDVCNRILVDEARHLGFNRVFLADCFSRHVTEDEDDGAAYHQRLRERLEDVLSSVPPMLEALDSELRSVGFDPERLVADLRTETGRRLEQSARAIRASARPGHAARTAAEDA